MAEGYKTLFVPREQYELVKAELLRNINLLTQADDVNTKRLVEDGRSVIEAAEAMEIEFKTI